MKEFAVRAAGDKPVEGASAFDRIALSKEDMKLLSSTGKLKQYAGYEVVAGEGDPGGRVWLVTGGLACVSRTDRDGRRTVLTFRWYGDLFGLTEKAVFVNTISAITDLTALEFEREHLQAILLRTPGLQSDLCAKITADLRQAQKHAVLLAGRSATSKVASFLIEFSAYPGCFDATAAILYLPISRLDIADFLGISLETVSRVLSKLSAQGYIAKIDDRQIRLDVPALVRLSGYE